jgi:peptide-methionine (S)-S-oxide reductase
MRRKLIAGFPVRVYEKIIAHEEFPMRKVIRSAGLFMILLVPPPINYAADQEVATFAGGCFWCMEPPFDKLPGVISTTSGYTGGQRKNPTYEEVSAGGTGHAEAVRIVYDPGRVSYADLLKVFWRNIDPLDGAGQFCDKGNQYRSAIFTHNEEQRRLAEDTKREIKTTGKHTAAIATRIEPAGEFYPAEEYHQDYYQKNPIRYKYYRYSCGRDQRLEQLWGKGEGG